MLNKKITFDRFIRWSIITIIVFTVLFILNYLSGVLLPFAVAWLFAYLLYPTVKFVQFKMRVRSRGVAIILTLLFVIAIIGLIFYLIIPPMIEQFDRLGEIVTRYLHSTRQAESIPAAIRDWLRDNKESIQQFFNRKDVADAVKSALPQVFTVLTETANIIISIAASLITLMYLFFILLDYEYLSNGWIKIFPKSIRPFWKSLMGDVEREMNNYIRGQSLVSLIMGILFCICFTIIDFPMAIGLGILIGIMNLVPYLHTFALIPAAFLALMKAADTGDNFWVIMAYVVAIFCIVQVIIEMIVIPKVMGKAMGLNPAILLLSLSVWGTVLGFIGLIIALPMTTILITYYQRYVTRENEQTSAAIAPAGDNDGAADETKTQDGQQ
ncbi:MAG: AI-2E family transporter [Prevotella sp.]|nr:AI-2E family transporter [Prevotella sp.]